MKSVCMLATMLLAGGCASYSTYRCPEPIGEIVRQDCDDFKVRYENLQAKLSFSIGSLSFGAEVGKEKLRDPSELVQVMMHQMLALCHDYNSCRVSNDEYTRRREQADRVFTAVMALLEQLKTPGLDEKSRGDLLGELFALLKGGEPPSAQPAGKPEEGGQTSPPRITAGAFREPWRWWYESKFQPPRPEPAANGLPFVLQIQPYYKKEALTHFFVRLWGEVEDDDQLFIEGGGSKLPCKIRRREGRPEGIASCKPERGSDMPQAESFRATYAVGATGMTHDFGNLSLEPGPRAGQTWLAYQPDPVHKDPIERERPWLVVFTASEKAPAVTARCWENGEPVIVEGSGALKSYTNITARNRFTGLTRFTIPLPYVLDYPEPPDAEEDFFGKHAGKWRCKISFDGLPVREVRFEIGKDGKPVPHPDQGGKPGDVASPWWLLESRELGELRNRT